MVIKDEFLLPYYRGRFRRGRGRSGDVISSFRPGLFMHEKELPPLDRMRLLLGLSLSDFFEFLSAMKAFTPNLVTGVDFFF